MENNQPIIVKRVKRYGDGHHGGSWKIAFADFATAMMAFFLVLWLLSTLRPSRKSPSPVTSRTRSASPRAARPT